ncbi:MAG: ABC transporter substrate-binding protein [Proteobacteria bacterium]|nr:ABC transporter substrate-binding protein [Pseudomonadota bacterium]
MLLKRHPFILLILLGLSAAFGCNRNDSDTFGEKDISDISFMSIGSFSVERIADNWTEVRDGAGRTLVLVPRGEKAPEGYEPQQVVQVPVKRVVAYGYFDIAILKTLGVLEDVLVGVTADIDEWTIPEVVSGMKSGKIAFLGGYSAIDFERLKQQSPELVLTWDPSIIPMMDEMGVACAITTTPVAMCLHARMRFVSFLAPFFNKEKKAKEYFDRVSTALSSIREKTKNVAHEPKVMWGDIYEKRVLVEPGNAWVGELVGLAQSDYQFDDVYGKSCIEISLERFLYSGKDADIFFTYRTEKTGATSKAALAKTNPLLARIKPLKNGKVFSPLPNYVQSGDKLDEILTDISAIIHPECYPGHALRYFREVPDKDPVTPFTAMKRISNIK